ncbi:uncharacterized protein LOC135924148 isoform X1 [Gordionus sp. m RMFG-2023]|uniref:uncharacterized protein LOC135924148 isoform X1 n=1 Tax=Gordionus sp. m RMFG-2023 TaxID=3053472 RepID=UPI0031FBCC44
MVFPRNLKEEAIKNGSILKRDSRINIVMMAYHHIAKITEARKNITYIILYKTAQMIKPRIKCVFNQESKMKNFNDFAMDLAMDLELDDPLDSLFFWKRSI